MADLLLNALALCNDLSIAKLYASITINKIICYNMEKYLCYYFDNETKLYVQSNGINKIATLIQKELEAYLVIKQQKNRDVTRLKAFETLIKKVGRTDDKIKIAKSYVSMCEDNDFCVKLNADPDVVNFKNGLVSLKTGKFRERTEKDYFSLCLKYDYSDEININKINQVANIINNTCNDDHETIFFNLHWLGYCLTGQTKEQTFLVTVGHSASNGKSTLSKMFSGAFDIYSVKLSSDTFAVECKNRHKKINAVKIPVRFARIEELGKKTIDVDFLKDFVDGEKIGGNEVLYSTTEDIYIQAKLNINSNGIPKFAPDEGIKRRGVQQGFRNKFILRKSEYEAEKHKKGVYRADEDLEKKFTTDNSLKLAFFHLLLPYCMSYYEERLNIPQQFIDNFVESCSDNDKMKLFIDKYYDSTGSRADRVFKGDIIDLYKYHTKIANPNPSNVTDELKRLGYEYDSKARVGGSDQGCFFGLRRKEEIAQDLFDNPGVEIKRTKPKENPLDANIDSDDSDSDSDSDSESESEEVEIKRTKPKENPLDANIDSDDSDSDSDSDSESESEEEEEDNDDDTDDETPVKLDKAMKQKIADDIEKEIKKKNKI